MKQSKERIQHWWQEAWLSNQIDNGFLGDVLANERTNEQPKPNSKNVQSVCNIKNTQSKRFFAEANIALPGLNSDNESVDDLFEALVVQRGRLKEMQQLREW